MKSILFLIIVFFVFYSIPAEIEVIENPKPTCTEKKYIPLIKTNIIKNEIDKNNLIIMPKNLAIDKNNNLFILDRMQSSIFKFNSKYELQTVFGHEGEGPGDFNSTRGSSVGMSVGRDQYLYVFDPRLHKIITFSPEGKLFNEKRISNRLPCNPVVDSKGNLYLLSDKLGVLDVYTKDMVLRKTLLTSDEYRKTLFYKPTFSFSVGNTYPSAANTFYSILSDDRLIIYINNASFLYLFNKDLALEKKLSIWPEKILKFFKQALKNQIDIDEEDSGIIGMSKNLVIDQDNEKYFYISFYNHLEGKYFFYKFDLNGNLENIYHVQDKNIVLWELAAKKNNRFYALYEGGIIILKEEENKI